MRQWLERSPFWPFIAAIGVTAGILAAVTVRYQKFLNWAFVIFIVVLLVVVALLFLRMQRQNERAKKIDEAIEPKPSHKGADSGAEDATGSERMRDELREAIRVLKTTPAGQRAMVKLPWYVVLGPKGSGKTEFIRRSGLDFIFHDGRRDPRAFPGVGGTRDFSWWLTQDAVLLDMGRGDLDVSEGEKDSPWGDFLGELLKARPRAPLNGLLVVVGVDQVAGKTEAQIDVLARQVRARIEEIESRLRIWLPVYVVFNGCDRIAGFSEFFEGEDPNQGWGSTVRLQRARTNPAQDIFDEEMDVLVSSLTGRRLDRVARLGDPVACARAFAFPLQFGAIRGAMHRYMKTLFDFSQPIEGARVDRRPFLRGFYLTAATQDGSTVDRVLQPAVDPLGLKLPPTPGIAVVAPSAWFAAKLLKEVVFRDTRLLGRSTVDLRGVLLKRGLAFGLAVVVWLVFLAISYSASRDNAKLLTETLSTVEIDRTQPLPEKLADLDKLSTTLDRLEERSQNPTLWQVLGGWSGQQVLERARQIWADELRMGVLDEAEPSMAARLARSNDSLSASPVELFHALAAYHLLHHPEDIKSSDSSILARASIAEVTSRLVWDGNGPEPKELLRNQMRLLARFRDEKKIVLDMKKPADTAATDPAVRRLAAHWPGVALLDPILLEAPAAYTPKSIASLVPKQESYRYLQCTAEVPGVFTDRAWEDYAKPEIGAYADACSRLEPLQRARTAAAGVGEVAPVLTDEYFRQYVAAWAKLVDSASPKGSPKDYLSNYMTDASELDKLLIGVSVYSTPEPVASQFQLLAEYTGPIDTKGANWFERVAKNFLKQKNEPATLAGQYRTVLDKTLKRSTELAAVGGADQGLASAGFQALARERVPSLDTQRGSKAVLSLLNRATEGGPPVHIPPPRDQWTGSISDPFQLKFAGKFPFASGAAQEVAIADFDAFFAPGGTLSQVVSQHFGYLDANGNARAGQQTAVGAATLAFIKKCLRIQKAFYPGNAATASMNLQLEVQDMRAVDAGNIFVTAGTLQTGSGAIVPLGLGASNVRTVVWPPPSGGDAMLTVAARKNPGGSMTVPPLRRTGIWGGLRLFLAGSPSGTDVVRLRWRLATADSPPIKFEVEVKCRNGGMPAATVNPLEPGLFAGVSPPSVP